MKLWVHGVVDRTSVEGPGERACVWVQGCSIQCPGCFNTHMWEHKGGSAVNPVALAGRFGSSSTIEGVTFLGGEPFEQAPAAAALAQAARGYGLSIMTFTGYLVEELRESATPGVDELLAATDLLVDGPYVAGLPDRRRPWVGSTNQRFHFLSSRYRHLQDRLEEIPDGIEVRLRRDGTVWLNGQAPARALASLRRELGRPTKATPKS